MSFHQKYTSTMKYGVETKLLLCHTIRKTAILFITYQCHDELALLNSQ